MACAARAAVRASAEPRGEQRMWSTVPRRGCVAACERKSTNSSAAPARRAAASTSCRHHSLRL